jgi:hypothetical protein
LRKRFEALGGTLSVNPARASDGLKKSQFHGS